MPGPAFIYSEKFQDYDYGGGHPLKMIRLKLTYELLKRYGVFLTPSPYNGPLPHTLPTCGGGQGGGAVVIEAEPCPRAEAEWVHSPAYLDVLKGIDEGKVPEALGRYGLGYGDNPAFRGVYAGSMLSTGASLQAARLVHSGGARYAFNISGGLHHAMPGRASGFCYINDPAVAIEYLRREGRKVIYIDIDAHHGDGVQHFFYDTDEVMTVSLHESGRWLFPGTGYPEDMGEGRGSGYSINLPFLPGTGDEVFSWGFFELVPKLVATFRPDVIVAQLGCDTFDSDPLTHLRLTTNGFMKMVEGILGFGLPVVALGGGGYDVTNVARAWSLAFAAMAGMELPDKLPDASRKMLRDEGYTGDTLMDEPQKMDKAELERQRDFAGEMLGKIERDILPVLGY